MILSYTIPNAKELITSGKKIHTLRADRSNAWKAGREIHHAINNRTPQYECFLQNKCISVQQVLIVLMTDPPGPRLLITVDRVRLSREQVLQLVQNDGFKNEDQMIDWFFKIHSTEVWGGKIIHWTNFKYE